jgi:O-succinylbenzoic acid--CoA ligase
MVNQSFAQLLTDLKSRCEDNWLIGYDNQKFYDLTLTYWQKFQQEQPKSILLAETEPFQFLAAFLGAVFANCTLFLGNPYWQQSEWEQVFKLIHPSLIISSSNFKLPFKNITTSSRQNRESLNIAKNLNHLIMIPTGGTSGKIRFAIHTWETLTASVEGFQKYFAVNQINSFCLLPLYHVSGLMQFLRSFLTQGKFLIYDYSQLKNNNWLQLHQDYFISLVPRQLQFILQHNSQWLSKFKTVLLGGAPAWQSLLETARQAQIPLSPTYGMTETAAQIVTLKPADFLAGNNSVGQVLPHAKITVCAHNHQQLKIQAKSLFFGYYPDYNLHLQQNGFISDDLGQFNAQGYLYILGRNSNKIITGGENVFPAEVEAVILETGLVEDIAVIGLSDSQWGEVVTAIYVPKHKHITSEHISLKIVNKIAKYKQPKRWFSLDYLPRNSQGKLDLFSLKQRINIETVKNTIC